MRAAVLVEPGRIEMQERPIPGVGDVLVHVSAVGVCGSDTHYFAMGGWAVSSSRPLGGRP